MGNVLAYFATIQVFVTGLLSLAVAGAISLRLPRGTATSRRVLAFLLIVSVGAILVVTLFREAVSWCGACWGGWVGADKISQGEVGLDVALNVMLFVPAALFATVLWRRPWMVAAGSLLLSLAVESLQPLMGVGVSDLMDLLANTVGGLIGAWLGSALLLVVDARHQERVSWRRILGLGVSFALAAVTLVAGPVWVSGQQQRAAAARLDEMFEGTTLSDYQKHRDGDWRPRLEQFWGEINRPVVIGRSSDDVAMERTSWNVYFVERCVTARWTPASFSTSSQSGPACTEPLELE